MTEPEQPTPEQIAQNIKLQAKALLGFLNMQGVAPPLTPETMQAYQMWQQCCGWAMGLSDGSLQIVQSNQNLLTPEMEAARDKAIADAEKKSAGKKPAAKKPAAKRPARKRK